MGYEIDFLPVGEGQRSGDAITLRFGDLNGDRDNQFVMVIDGGTTAAGEALCKHVRTNYSTDFVDLVLSTHPDADHASGLAVVLDQLEVGQLWMHRPWLHAADIKALFRNGKITTTSLRENLRRALENAYDLERLAIEKGIPIVEPFAGTSLPFSERGLTILSPTQIRYEELLPHFRETPQPRTGAGLFERIASAAGEAVRWVGESMNIETLVDPEVGDTSAENETSAVILIQVDGHQLLFTGDAGVLALTDSGNQSSLLKVDLRTSRFVQVPHHGSRHNVGPTVLDRIVGAKNGGVVTKTAYVSAAKEGMGMKHPSKKVVNAFKRRGAEVYATQGKHIRFHYEAPPRPGWSPIQPLPFYDSVEG